MKVPLAMFAAALVACSVVIPVSAQSEATVAVKDVSREGSPLSFSGTVAFSETVNDGKVTRTHGEQISAKNVSYKAILALRVSTSFIFPDGYRGEHTTEIDRFFTPDLIVPGETVQLSWPLGQTRTTASRKGPPHIVEPVAEAKVLYVQFEDGSEFGNEAEGYEILSLRRSTWEALRGVDKVYEEEGADEFMKALNKPIMPHSALHSVLQSILRTAGQSGPPEAEKVVQRMLALATEHEGKLDTRAK
jgi:hypothetical protein